MPILYLIESKSLELLLFYKKYSIVQRMQQSSRQHAQQRAPKAAQQSSHPELLLYP